MEEGHGNLYKWDLKLKKLCVSKWGSRTKTFATLLTADFSCPRYFQMVEKSKEHLFLPPYFLFFPCFCQLVQYSKLRSTELFRHSGGVTSAQHQVIISRRAFKWTQLQLLPFATEAWVNTAKFKICSDAKIISQQSHLKKVNKSAPYWVLYALSSPILFHLAADLVFEELFHEVKSVLSLIICRPSPHSLQVVTTPITTLLFWGHECNHVWN